MTTIMRLRLPALLILPILMTGCSSLDTPYARPETPPLPAHWPNAPLDTQGPVAISGAWWQDFGNRGLNAMMARVLAQNNQLAAAGIGLRRAGMQAGLTSVDRAPTLNGGLSGNSSRPLDGGASSRSLSTTVSVSYEVDLWNRLGNLHNAAQWEATATAEERQALILTLAGTAATLYFQIGHLHERIAFAEANLASARRVQVLVESQVAAGAATPLEQAQVRQTVQAQDAAITQLRQQLVEARNGLLVLTGGDISGLPEARSVRSFDLPVIGAGVPAELLSRRPDLRAAEARLRATLATADATRTSFYPGLSLTGSAGSSSRDLGNIIANPVGSLAMNTAFAFLNVERNRLNTDIARSRFDEAAMTFRQSLLQAFADVDNALSARGTLRAQGQSLAAALDSARTVESIYSDRYTAGSLRLRDWLDAQDSRRNAEVALLENRLAQLQNQVKVYQVLGGGVPVSSRP